MSGLSRGGHIAFRPRLEESAAFLAPAALIGVLSPAERVYELRGRGVVRLILAGLLILGFALWSAISSLWSGSVELSVVEADRVLVYLGIFLAAFLLTQTDQRRQRFGQGGAFYRCHRSDAWSG